MDVLDAAHATAHGYPGGAEALAIRMGKAPGALRQELLGKPTHKLGLRDAAAMIDLTGDHRIIHALCAQVGMVAIPVDANGARGGDLLGMLLDQHAATGDMAAAVRAAVADGVVTANELSDIADRVADKIAGLQAVMRELHAAHCAGRAGALS